MFYADVELSGATASYKKKFMKMVDNRHAYYMPDHAGMCDKSYREIDADHHIYVRIKNMDVFNRIVDVLHRRYRFTPDIRPKKPTDEVYGRQDKKTYEQLDYMKEDYWGIEVYPDLEPDDRYPKTNFEVMSKAMQYKDKDGAPTFLAPGSNFHRDFHKSTLLHVLAFTSGKGESATYNYREFWIPDGYPTNGWYSWID